jgi:asparagine synthase (glutamine-hydrolysing)
MPGLIGFVEGAGNGRNSHTLLPKMARALEPDERFKVDCYHGDGVGLGRVSLGILNPQPQPIWNEDQTLCLVMDGEVYDYAALKQELIQRGHRFRVNNDAEFVLHLYEEFGNEFIQKLNGPFVVAIWDTRAKKLILANDRLGLLATYYAVVGNSLVFGGGVRAVLADTAVPLHIDRTALAQFLTFDHCLHDRTFVQAVKLLPPGSLLTWQDGHVTLEATWRPRHPLQYELISERDWLEMTKAAMRTAVKRQTGGNLRQGMLLSGGLDSRYLLALLRDGLLTGEFHTFTWGIPNCDDARFAKEVATQLGTTHHFFELRPDWLLGLADECVRQVDGLGNILNLHARAVLDQCAPFAEVIFKGFLGDAMAGYAQMHQHWADYDDETRIRAHQAVHRANGVITFEEAEQEALFTDDFRAAVGSAVWDAYREGMNDSGSTQLADQRIYFDYRQRVPRHTLNGVEVVRARAATRLPFADNDLVDLFLRMPPGLRDGRRVMRDAFIEAYPDLAKIPSPDDGLPLINCARDVRIRAARLLRWQLNKAGLKGVSYMGLRPYKDYPNWFRGPLRPWVEATLLDKRHLERGYYQPDFIRRLVSEHMSGQQNHVLRLGALLTIELWHRQFIDRNP